MGMGADGVGDGQWAAGNDICGWRNHLERHHQFPRCSNYSVAMQMILGGVGSFHGFSEQVNLLW